MSRGPYGSSVETVPGTLRGYRAWGTRRNWKLLGLFNPVLYAINQSLGPWEHKTVIPARCRNFFDEEYRGTHRSPSPHCACGYYATYSDEYMTLIHGVPRAIHGSITAWGRISLGTQGFRAEYARVESLWGPGSRAAARRYGVPWFRTQAQMLAEFPPQDVTELLQ